MRRDGNGKELTVRLVIQPDAADDGHLIFGQGSEELSHVVHLARGLGLEGIRALEHLDRQ